jgi:replication factor C large subunit
MRWADKYKPKSSSDVIGQGAAISTIKDWLSNWKPGSSCLLVSGPPGCGKTCMVAAIAKDSKLDLFEMNASDERTGDAIKKALTPVTKQASLFGRGKLILIDEIDGLSGTDRGATTELINIMKSSRFPMIFTANDAYDQRIKPVREKCKLLQLKRVMHPSINNRLMEICKAENIDAEPLIIKQIAMSSGGDVRAAISDLETLASGKAKITNSDIVGYREREKNIFDVLKIMFRARTMKTAVDATFQCDKDLEEIFWWVEQNICSEFRQPQEIADAYDLLSRADLFREKIMKNQNYRFTKYIRDMLCAIPLYRTSKPADFNMYKPSDRIITLGRTKAARMGREKTFEELGKIMHCSKRKVANNMPVMEIFLGVTEIRDAVELVSA